MRIPGLKRGRVVRWATGRPVEAFLVAVVVTVIVLRIVMGGGWSFKWLWSDNGVGNFTDDMVLLTVGYFRVWKKHVHPHLRRTKELHEHLIPPGKDGGEV